MILSAFLLLAVAADPPPSSDPGNHKAAPIRAEAVPPGRDGPRQRPFVSPVGEAFRLGEDGVDPLEAWFRKADGNGDGMLVVAELQQDARRFYVTLDTDGDGEIEPDEMTVYERDVASLTGAGAWAAREAGGRSEARPRGPRGGGPRQGGRGPGGGGGGGGMARPAGGPSMGSSRFGLLDIPQPVASADSNFNRGVSRSELEAAAAQRFILLDTDRDGSLKLTELAALRDARRSAMPDRGNRRGKGGPKR